MNAWSRALLAILAVSAALAAATVGFAADGDEKVVFTVGVVNDYDTLNPVVGVEVPDYEVWNLQYATLTDKAAADFSTIPGLAESWEASADGKTFTYKLRDGLTWSDGTPLTAEDIAYTVNRANEEEWLNYDSTVTNLTAKVIDDHDGRDRELGTRSEAAGDGRLHPPKARLGQARQERGDEVQRRRRRRVGPVHARRGKARAVLAVGGKRHLLGWQARDRRGHLPAVQQR